MAWMNPFPTTYQPVQSYPTTIPNYSGQVYQNVPQVSTAPQIPTVSQIQQQQRNSAEIIWVADESEVQNYIVEPNQNAMFMDINRMKMYTKDGSNGLIRDFDLVESQESMRRYQQRKQIENAQFPVIDAEVREVGYSGAEMSNIEQKMNEKFDILERRIAEISQNLNNGYKSNSQKKRYPDKPKEGDSL